MAKNYLSELTNMEGIFMAAFHYGGKRYSMTIPFITSKQIPAYVDNDTKKIVIPDIQSDKASLSAMEDTIIIVSSSHVIFGIKKDSVMADMYRDDKGLSENVELFQKRFKKDFSLKYAIFESIRKAINSNDCTAKYSDLNERIINGMYYSVNMNSKVGNGTLTTKQYSFGILMDYKELYGIFRNNAEKFSKDRLNVSFTDARAKLMEYEEKAKDERLSEKEIETYEEEHMLTPTSFKSLPFGSDDVPKIFLPPVSGQAEFDFNADA